jgi:predicted GTPase
VKLGTRWLLWLAITALPLVLLLLAGLAWLWNNGLMLAWLALAALIGIAGWLVGRKLEAEKIEPVKLVIDPPVTWPAQGAAAWQTVEQIAKRIQREDPPLDKWPFYWNTLKEVMQAVALHYHPEQKNAILEMRVPYLLKVIELLAQDLRVAFAENIPGSHILTINDMVRGRRLASKGAEIYKLYRIVAAGVDPVSALVRELRGLATDRLLKASAREVKLWLLDAYVKKIGYYAIELYSGHLVLNEEELRHHTTEQSQRDAEAVKKRTAVLDEEPLRVLVLGQAKAGKSSLINALFGELKAPVDVLPKTGGVQPYLLERNDLERAIILDSAGFEDTDNPLKPLAEAEQEILRSDLILLVCSAKNAARHADSVLLRALEARFREKTGEEPPPVLVVLSHIDQLRPFREWDPPYDIAYPERPKARMIRQAMEAVVNDLGLAIEQVVPVNLKSGQEYNIETGLLPAILQNLDAAQRLKYLRCLADYREEEYWKQLWLQSKNTGKFIARKGFQWIDATGKRLDRSRK